MKLTTLADAVLGKLETRAQQSDDGYFGWTDRYGMRASFLPQENGARAERRPFFTANY